MSLKTATDVDPIKSERTGNVREVGSQAIWSLSSCKPGKLLLQKAVSNNLLFEKSIIFVIIVFLYHIFSVYDSSFKCFHVVLSFIIMCNVHYWY